MYTIIAYIVVGCLSISALQAQTDDSTQQIKSQDSAHLIPKKKHRDKKPKPETPTATASTSGKKTLSHMNYEELKKSKIEVVKSGNKTSAIKYLEKMVPVCSDLSELKEIMLELANLLSETGAYEKASKMYHEFTVLYPGADEVEFAMYQSVVNSFKLTLDAEHDQTKTADTRELAQTFLERTSFTTHKKEVEQILSQCDQKLFESEANIFNFYMSRGNHIAAKQRLTVIKDTYLDKTVPEIHTRIALLEAEYTTATHKPEEQKNIEVASQEQKPFKDRF